MQIAACPEVEYLRLRLRSDHDCTRKEIEMKKEDLQSKPENIREKIVQGRIDKMVNEKASCRRTTSRIFQNGRRIDQGSHCGIGREDLHPSLREIQLGRRYRKERVNFAAEIAAATGQAKFEK